LDRDGISIFSTCLNFSTNTAGDQAGSHPIPAPNKERLSFPCMNGRGFQPIEKGK
jgi:hypothetical protein